jgi:hypothetical protein
MLKLAGLSVFALALASVPVMASTGEAVVGASRIAAATESPAAQGSVRQGGGAQACLEAEIPVYSHHSGEFWCASVK